MAIRKRTCSTRQGLWRIACRPRRGWRAFSIDGRVRGWRTWAFSDRERPDELLGFRWFFRPSLWHRKTDQLGLSLCRLGVGKRLCHRAGSQRASNRLADRPGRGLGFGQREQPRMPASAREDWNAEREQGARPQSCRRDHLLHGKATRVMQRRALIGQRPARSGHARTTARGGTAVCRRAFGPGRMNAGGSGSCAQSTLASSISTV